MLEFDEKLLPWRQFLRRSILHLLVGVAFVAIALAIGLFGYHYIAGLKWIDALLNASMILTGMGPVDEMVSNSAKVFASLYALFSGVVFLSSCGVIFAPHLHRLLHKFHLEGKNPEK